MQSSPEVWKEFFETYYRDELNRAAEKAISLNGSTPINVNFLKDLVIFKEGIVAEELLDYPDIVLDHANHGIANSENIHNVKLENSRARVYNLPISRRVLIRDLRSEHISKLVSIDGVVRKVTEVRPRVIEAAFVCSSCAVKMFIYQDDSTIKYPYECKSCGSRKFIFLPEESRSIDSQRMRIQEYPENLRGGEQPQTLDVVLENDLTGIVNPGDRVVINGIVRATPRSVSGKRLRHMDITLEGNSIEVLQQEYEEFEITEEDKKKILEIGNDPEVFDNIVKSIAPVIYGYEDMKMAVALQLFGGIPKKLPDGTEIRGDVHVLLVGDPGVAKSQLLRYVHRIAPRSVYTTGKGTTSAGLCVAPESLIF
ncbi:MAG: AAA family ATPase, partial [Archaeoglobaceae archaeon]